MALRVGAPVFVADQVIEEAGLSVEMQDVPIEGLDIAAMVEAITKDDTEAPDQVTQQVDVLKERLQEAVVLEEYEEAARLRVRLASLCKDVTDDSDYVIITRRGHEMIASDNSAL